MGKFCLFTTKTDSAQKLDRLQRDLEQGRFNL